MLIARAARRTAVPFGILTLILASSPAIRAQGRTTPRKAADSQQSKQLEELRNELREMRQGQEAIQKELDEIKRLLTAKLGAPARPAPPEKISIEGRPIRGDHNARVVVVEFSDYQCPYCGLFFRNTMPQLEQEYIKAGKIRYVFNNLPLEEIHSFAFKAAQAAECAGEQGKFWELHDRLFANQNALSPGNLTTQAASAGLDMAKYSQCVASTGSSAGIRRNLQQAMSLGIEGTPAFVIGIVDAKDLRDPTIKIVATIGGAQPFQVFKQAIDKILASQN
jgi:protein-disulfide isomerase